MAEMDDDVVDEVSVDTDEATEETVTYEEAMEWKAKAERTDKAEKKIVELKRQSREIKETPNGNDESYTKQDAMLDKFIAKNPDLEGSEEEIKGYLAKGIEMEEAKILVQNKDKTVKNLKKMESMSVSASEKSSQKQTYTESEIKSMSDTEYAKIASGIRT